MLGVCEGVNLQQMYSNAIANIGNYSQEDKKPKNRCGRILDDLRSEIREWCGSALEVA
jgi:hypothetical protein